MSPVLAAETGVVETVHQLEEMAPELDHVPGLAHTNATSEDAEIKARQKAVKRKLVRRQHAWTIAAAWIITVPLAAGLAAILYVGMKAAGVHP